VLRDARYTISNTDLACLLFNLSITLIYFFSPAFVGEYTFEVVNPMGRSQAVHVSRESGKRHCLIIYQQQQWVV